MPICLAGYHPDVSRVRKKGKGSDGAFVIALRAPMDP